MADRYPTRPGAPNPPNHESDPLAELARLIGQTDPFANFGRPNPQQQTPDPYHDPYEGQEQGHEPTFDPEPYPEEPQVADNRPAWLRKMQGHQQPAPELRYAEPPHQPVPQPVAPPWSQRPGTARAPDRAPDPARYNDVLFGQAQAAPAGWPAASGPHPGYPEQDDSQHYDAQQYGEQQYDQSYEQDAYPYQAEDDEPVDVQRRNGGLLTAIVVASLAVVGTASAFGYRYYHGGYSRSGDAPIIYADKGPTKITPATTADASGKFNDRVGGNGEQIVPREEQPVNVQPRVVFPTPNQSVATGVATSGVPTSPIPVAPSIAAAVQNSSQQASADPGQPTGNGAMDEPKKIKVLTIHGDNSAAPPTPTMMPPIPSVPAPASAPPKRVATTAPAATIQTPARATSTAPAAGGGPLSLSPNAATAPAPSTRTQVANIAPTAPSGGGGYVVQVSSQRNEADAQNSYRAMQSKYPSVLGSRSPFIKRVDLGDKGVYYRAMVGPFASSEEAGQFCGDLKSAGGQCVVQRN